ncbi:hypothetical protein Tco_0985286 [Tanacetum coccineum]
MTLQLPSRVEAFCRVDFFDDILDKPLQIIAGLKTPTESAGKSESPKRLAGTSMFATPSQQTTETDATLSLIVPLNLLLDTPAPATPMPSEINLQTTENNRTSTKLTGKGESPKILEISTTPTEPSSAETSPQLPGN